MPGQGYHVWHWEQDSVHHGHRLLLVMLYLNDVEEGGETEFLYANLKIQPKKGRLLMFPPNFCYPHIGEKVNDKPKYIIGNYAHIMAAKPL